MDPAGQVKAVVMGVALDLTLAEVLMAMEASGETWAQVEEDDVIGVDARLVFHRWRVQELAGGDLFPPVNPGAPLNAA